MRLIRGRCDEIGDCWIWKGATGGRSELPCMHYNGKTQYVRRVVYEITHGQAVGKRVVSPACENSLCVSPACAEAMARKTALQRAGKRGAYSGHSKIMASTKTQRAKSRYSDDLIAMIRTSDAGPLQLSRETGMSLSYVKAIRSGKFRREYANPFCGLFTSLMAANESTARRTA